ncbi:MAG: type II toxin-antitoxin system VapC family toxin [Acidobacteriia bacterium]|nr:type II toxin-antitoxin system VapC family toxin [Terriglobia bacterium]
MILVDTSVWVDHLRRGAPRLIALLNDGEVACHAFVIGELACGRLQNRTEILRLLHRLPLVPSVEEDEFLELLEANPLPGSGIGFVDAHLLASAVLSGLPLWTLDRKLRAAAKRLGCSYG